MNTGIIEARHEKRQSAHRGNAIHLYFHLYLYFLDMAALIVSSLVVYVLLDISSSPETWLRYGLAVTLTMLAYSVFGFANGLYDWHRFHQQIKQPYVAFGGIIFGFGALILVIFAFKITADYSRLWLGFWLLTFAGYILISRVVLVWHLSSPASRNVRRRQAIILGAGENGREVLDHLIRFDDQDIRVIGFLDDRMTRLSDSYRGVPVLGATPLAESLICEQGIDLIIMALPWTAHERIDGLLQKLSSWAVDIYMAPDKLGLRYADRPVLRVGGMHVLSLKDRPISDWNAVVKRIEDLCLVIPALVLLSPLMVIVALAIRIESRGPVLFVQDRYGFNNNLIKVYKFRSMYTEMTDHHCERQTVKNDPRVTRVGRFIRYTSIDELPQLFNVIQGSMSVVGPRPHAKGTKSEGRLLEDVVSEYASRHRVKPGITGWAQCNGWRGETDTCEKIVKRVEHDLFYIENWSVFLDILIIVKTLLLLFKKQENAY
ncbi:undecaprenyl-phosphate glucose phosphotransferase [Thiobaca trueperi]|uniref:Undecaprenyl-phosphate glucose phosphotransferase n=1 Tax=Thiobaca trueperi TaxID=127458 RepID=A0A4R3MR51_9GAMM|nr:undecaprenyl-phosphate glucose phosphotransferase [Thiobaca trueperi]TCT18694.1 Undecaprenyl-phosphate glucose phosphotransferase [Thiobaca trueperi]